MNASIIQPSRFGPEVGASSIHTTKRVTRDSSLVWCVPYPLCPPKQTLLNRARTRVF